MKTLSCLIVLLTATLCLPTAQADTIAETFDKQLKRPQPAALRTFIAENIASPRQNEAMHALDRALDRYIGSSQNPRLPKSKLTELTALTDALLLFILAAQEQPPPALNDTDFKTWLFANQQRSDSFLDFFSIGDDNFNNAVSIIHQLYQHDPKRRDDNWNLILAFALVWDKKPQPLHDQIGPNALDFSPDITNRYDFFKETLRSSKAPFRFNQLNVSTLCFIIDTPVPVSELQWAQENANTRKPQNLFDSIQYDHRRLQAISSRIAFAPGSNTPLDKSPLYWTHGPYTLQAIKNRGGLCVDQAYFTTLVLRAKGIPAILFTGIGRRGGHAWVAYMKSLNKWDTDIGRIEKDNYTTGHATHPQTGDPFNDHVLPLVCEKMQPPAKKENNTNALTRLAFTLKLAKRERAARQAAQLAINAKKTNIAAWNILADCARTTSALTNIVDEHEETFKKYPDVVYVFKQRVAAILKEKGKDEAADNLMETNIANTKDRDDITRKKMLDMVNAALQDGDVKKARITFEKHLREQRKEVAKILNDIKTYLEFTRETKQTKEAVAFLEPFLRSARRSFKKIIEDDERYKNWDALILIEAYENNGDSKKANRLKRKISR